MVTTVGGVQIEIRGDKSDFSRTMREVQRDAGRTGQSVAREFQQADRAAQRLNTSIKGSSSAFAGLLSVASGGILAGAIIQAADAFAGMRSKIALSISAADDLLAVEKQLYQQAIANRAALEPIVSLYQRIRGSRADLSNEQTLEITDRFSKSLVISGASAQGAASATLQFSQAIAGGVLRAEEFNSIIESNVRFVKLLADNLGVSVGQIRNLVNEGAITSDVIFKAIRENGADLDAEFTKIPLTVSSALVNVRNAFTNYVGLADQAGGSSAKLAGFINSIANDFDRLAEVVLVAAATIGGAGAGLLAARFVSGLLAIATASGTAAGAVGALRAQLAFFGGPVGLAITAVGAAFAFLAITAEDSLDKVARATGDYDRAVSELTSTQDELKGQYAALEKLNRDMAKAIEDGAAAAEQTAAREIDALQLRIDKNRELLGVYEEQAAAALDDARLARDQSRNDFAQAIGLPRRFDFNTNPEARAELERATQGFRAQLAELRATGQTLDDNTRKARDYFIAWQEAEQQVTSLTRRQGERIVAAGVAAFGITTPTATGGQPPAATELSEAEQKAADLAAAQLADQLSLLSGLERELALRLAIADGNAELVQILEDTQAVNDLAAEFAAAGLTDAEARAKAETFIADEKERAAAAAEREAGIQQRVDLFRLGQEQAKKEEEKAKAAAEAFRDQISNGLARGLEEGIRSGNWGEAFEGVLSEATSSALSRAIDELADELAGLLAGLFDGIGSSIGVSIGSLFAGGRAAGGSVRAGMRYMVGEQGPEMFVPTVPGMIVPKFEGPMSAAAGGAMGRSVYVDAKMVIQGSVTEEVLPRVQAMMAAQARELPRIVDARVSDSLRRGRY
jgi:tape measure domain-containing protein